MEERIPISPALRRTVGALTVPPIAAFAIALIISGSLLLAGGIAMLTPLPAAALLILGHTARAG